MTQRNSRKGGRHELPESLKRNKIVQTKLSKAETEIMMSRAKNAGITKYEYMRRAILSAEIVLPISAEQWDILKALSTELRNIGINVNIIAKKANSNLARDYANDLRLFLQDIQRIKDAYYEKLL